MCEWYLLTFIIMGVRAARVGATSSTSAHYGGLANNAAFRGVGLVAREGWWPVIGQIMMA